jgi:hypothetical protein
MQRNKNYYLFISNSLKTPTVAVWCRHYIERTKYGHYMTLKSTSKFQYPTILIKSLFKFLFTQINHNTSVSINW